MNASSKKPIKNLTASVHARLTTLARERGRPFQEILEYYAIERFLFRLSQSPHADQFVLKGAQVLLAWGIPLQRPTRDIDLQASAATSDLDINRIIKEICAQPVEPDGLTFDEASIHVEPIITNAKPPGVRVRFVALLANVRIPMQIDINFAGDSTIPVAYVEYPPTLGMPAPRLRGYSHVTVIAEKFHAMVTLGMLNSRLRDYYDIWVVSQVLRVKGGDLTDAITRTFEARRTPLRTVPPPSLSDEFAQERQRDWQALVNSFPQTRKVPTDFQQLLADLRTFLLPPLRAATSGETLQADWNPGGPWGPS